MNKGPENVIRPAATSGVRVPRHMRGMLEMGGTGEYLSGLRAAHEASGITRTTGLISQRVTERTNGTLNHHTPINHAISGGRLDANLSEHTQHGSTGDYREGLIAASIAARTAKLTQ